MTLVRQFLEGVALSKDIPHLLLLICIPWIRIYVAQFWAIHRQKIKGKKQLSKSSLLTREQS